MIHFTDPSWVCPSPPCPSPAHHTPSPRSHPLVWPPEVPLIWSRPRSWFLSGPQHFRRVTANCLVESVFIWACLRGGGVAVFTVVLASVPCNQGGTCQTLALWLYTHRHSHAHALWHTRSLFYTQSPVWCLKHTPGPPQPCPGCGKEGPPETFPQGHVHTVGSWRELRAWEGCWQLQPPSPDYSAQEWAC